MNFKYQMFMESMTDMFYEDKENQNKAFKENYYLQENLVNKYIAQVLSKPKNRDLIMEFTAAFIDKHHAQLNTSGPVYMFTFDEKEVQPLYDLFGLTPETILELYDNMVNDTFYGSISSFISGWVVNAPHKILITGMLICGIQNEYQDIIECCEYFWAFCEYPVLYRKFWKQGVKEDVMSYTIEHISVRFKIKKFKNLQALLKYDSHTSIEAHKEELAKGLDNAYTDLMRRMRNQFRNTLANIANMYYMYNKEGASQHAQGGVLEDGNIADQQGHSTNIDSITTTIINKVSSGSYIDTLVQICANAAKVDKSTLKGFINQVIADKNNKIATFVELVISYYFSKYPNNTSIVSSEFVNVGLSLFRSLTSKSDEVPLKVRVIVDYWMNDVINISSLYNHTAINTYTRAVYNYFILLVNYYNQ